MNRLTNRRILVVEDEFLIAAALCDMLQDASAIVVGPAVSIGQALQLLEGQRIDGAILDINLNGQLSDPIAEVLATRQIPFVFTTGYGANDRADRFGVAMISKPYSWEQVEECLLRALAACPGADTPALSPQA